MELCHKKIKTSRSYKQTTLKSMQKDDLISYIKYLQKTIDILIVLQDIKVC